MGSYLIPNALSLEEVVEHIGAPTMTQTWERKDDGVLFVDTAKTDAACRALYDDFVPSGQTDIQYVPALATRWEEKMASLRAFRDDVRAGQIVPTTLTSVTQLAEAQQRLADVIDLLAYLVPRLEASS